MLHKKIERVLIERTPSSAPRFLTGPCSPEEIARSLSPDDYFSHETAAYMHGLTGRLSTTRYISAEGKPRKSIGAFVIIMTMLLKSMVIPAIAAFQLKSLFGQMGTKLVSWIKK